MDQTDLVCLRIIAGISNRGDIDVAVSIFDLDNSATVDDIRSAACEHIARRLNNLSEGVQLAHERAK